MDPVKFKYSQIMYRAINNQLPENINALPPLLSENILLRGELLYILENKKPVQYNNDANMHCGLCSKFLERYVNMAHFEVLYNIYIIIYCDSIWT